MILINLTRWPALAVIGLAGLSAVALAFISVNLFAIAMANLDFIQRHGLVALREGALVQLLQLTGTGLVALTCYLVFKICEAELVFRYFRWAGRVEAGMTGRRQLRFRRERKDKT